MIGGVALWSRRTSRAAIATLRDERDDLAFSRIAVAHADDGLLVMDMQGIIRWVNPAYCRIMGYTAAEVIGRNPLGFAFVTEQRPDAETLRNFRFDTNDPAQQGLQLYQNQRKNGGIFWNQINTSFYTTPAGRQYAVLVCRDVTSTIEKEKQLEATSLELAHLAAHDDLTGAANRATLTKFLDRALQQARTDGTRIGVLNIDLDKFKHINDSYGHSAGDAVLVAVVKRIRANIRETDLLARVGGDEFVVIYQGLQSLTDLQVIGAGLIAAVNRTLIWQSTRLHCQISIGAALSSDMTESAASLLLQSDFALYEVKRTGRGKVVAYNRDLHDRHTRETELAADLQAAVSENGLSFHFQPIIDVNSGAVCSIETLVRWHHPREGFICPSEFLPIAQSLGLAAAVDFHALQAALDMKRQLDQSGFTAAKVSFNASSDLLAHAEFLPRLTEGLRTRGLNGSNLIIEILEAVVSEIEQGRTKTADTLADLRRLGVATVLDDFGGGHTGLTHLSRLPMNGVKIDGSLTQRFLDDPKIDRIFATLITLCRELGLTVTTEGVETYDQAKRLAELGSTTIQGCWITPPLASDALIDWLNTATHCPRLSPSLSKGQLTA